MPCINVAQCNVTGTRLGDDLVGSLVFFVSFFFLFRTCPSPCVESAEGKATTERVKPVYGGSFFLPFYFHGAVFYGEPSVCAASVELATTNKHTHGSIDCIIYRAHCPTSVRCGWFRIYLRRHGEVKMSLFFFLPFLLFPFFKHYPSLKLKLLVKILSLHSSGLVAG